MSDPVDFFVSYNQADRPWAVWIAWILEERNYTTLIQAWDFRAGTNFVEEMDRATKAHHIIAVLSPDYMKSEFARPEWQAAFARDPVSRKNVLLPVRVRTVEIEGLLKQINYADLVGLDEETARDALVKAVKGGRGKPDKPPQFPGTRAVAARPEFPTPNQIAPAAFAVPPPCPYPGSQAFSGKFSLYFHGRAGEVDHAIGDLTTHRFIFVVGPSGAGKSSMVFGGLLPKLEAAQGWKILRIEPAPRPAGNIDFAVEGVRADPVRAVSALLASEKKERLLVVVDQFEECLTQADPGEQAEFIRILQRLHEVPSCSIVLVLRAMFFEELMKSKLWSPSAIARVELTPLEEAAMREAIVRPARDSGITIDHDLVESLIADARDEPGRLPLLQTTLEALWTRLRGNRLTLNDYKEWAGRERNRLAVAMGRKADDALGRLPPEQRTIAKRVFMRLIQFVEGRPETRRRQPLSALKSARDDPDMFRSTLEVLAGAHLITLGGSGPTESEYADLPHEALLTTWPRLGRWIREGRAPEQIRRLHESKAAEWVRLGRDAGGTLEEIALSEVERWLSAEGAAEASQDLLDMVEASRSLADLRKSRDLEVQAASIASDAAGELENDPPRALSLAVRAVEMTGTGRIVKPAEEILRRALLRVPLRLQHTFQDGIVLDLCFALKETVAVALDTGELAVCTFGEAASVRKMQAHSGPVRCLRASQDGRRLISAGDDGVVKIWDHASLNLAFSLRCHEKRINFVSFNYAGTRFITASDDETAAVWEVSTSEKIRVLEGHKGAVRSASFGRDNDTFLTASNDATAIVWSAHMKTVLAGHVNAVLTAAWNSDGSLAITGGEDRTVKIWDARSGHLDRTLGPFPSAVTSASFSSDGKVTLSTAGEDRLRLYESRSGTPRLPIHLPGLTVTSAAFSQDGQSIAAAAGRSAMVLKTKQVEDRPVFSINVYECRRALFSPDGRRIFTANGGASSVRRTNNVIILDASSGVELQTLGEHQASVNAVAFSPRGSYVLTASDDATAILWNGKRTLTITGDNSPLTCCAFHPSKDIILTAGESKAIRLWNSKDGKPLVHFTGHIGKVHWAAFSPDGASVASCGADGTIRLWSLASGEQTLIFNTPSALRQVVFHTNSRFLISAADNGTAAIWDTQVEGPPRILAGHKERINGVAIGTDGKTVATAGADKTLRLWYFDTGEERHRFTFSHSVQSVDISSDGKRLLALVGSRERWFLHQRLFGVEELLAAAKVRLKQSFAV